VRAGSLPAGSWRSSGTRLPQPLLRRGSTRAVLREMYEEGRFVGAGLGAMALEALAATP